MSENTQGFGFLKISPAEMLKCIRKDFIILILAAAVIATGGAGFGKLTTKTTSSAQLVMSPMPLVGKAKVKIFEGRASKDDLEAMLAAPLDVKSASLLCMSDEVLQKTLDQVNQSGSLSQPLKDIKQLRAKLNFTVAVEKETPYDITYAPLIVLMAESKRPSDAKLIVNTWSHVVMAAAKKFQDAVQGPVAKALIDQKNDVRSELTKAELESEKFWTENNVLYLEMRLNDISAQINNFKRLGNEARAEIAFDNATAETLTAMNTTEVPDKIKLEWKLPAPLGAMLGAKPETQKDGKAEGVAMTGEVANTAHLKIVEMLAAAKANAAAKTKKIDEYERMIGVLEEDRLKVQAEFAKATTGKIRAARELLRLEEEFHDIAMKQEFAQVASNLDQPVMQVISEGTEWPVSRFGRAIQFGITSGIFGFIAAACLSVLLRLFVKPLLTT